MNKIKGHSKSGEIALSAQGVTVEYDIAEYKSHTFKEFVFNILSGRHKVRKFRAVDNVDLILNKGESLAIIGHNGSGKSTLLKVLAGIIEPKGLNMQVYGRVAPMIELGAGFDGELSGIENIRLSCLIMGLTEAEIKDRIESIIDFSELREFINMPLKNYSSGMYARLGFACATAVDPDILLVDEVLSVGDSNFSQKCLAKIDSLKARGTSVVIVTHDEMTVQKFCDRAMVMNRGKVVFKGSVEDSLRAHQEVMQQRQIDASGEQILNETPTQQIESIELLDPVKASELEGPLPEELLVKTPSFAVKTRLFQNNEIVYRLDFLKPFFVILEISDQELENFPKSAIFAIEFYSPSGRRMARVKTNEILMPDHSEQAPSQDLFSIEVSFSSGLPFLYPGHYLVKLGVFDVGTNLPFYLGHVADVTSSFETDSSADDLEEIRLDHFAKIEVMFGDHQQPH
jgi:ABC-type polysaccharide/polyol phosphate transport system ATPase subunit